VRLIYTPFAVLIGIIYGYLPLMVFPIYVSLDRLDKRLLEASADLGAPAVATFLQVTLPLSIPGIATGCMLVFILLMGEFLIPALLGGGKVFFVGNALVDLFLQSRNWAFGSAVAVTLIAIMLVTVTVYMRLIARLNTASATTLDHVRAWPCDLCRLRLCLPLHADRDHRALQLQRRAARQPVRGLLGPVVRTGARQPFVMDALATSLFVAFVSATLASILGTLAAVGLQGIRGPARAVFDAVIYIAVMIPGIVIGIATLIALVTLFDVVNPWLAVIWPEGQAPPSCRWASAR
jgi:ABC-type spermidine/putrescine transport system permease subunit I